MRILLSLLLFLLTLFPLAAQRIVQLDKFEPFELVGDTLYFNRQGNHVVQVVDTIFRIKNGKHKKIKDYRTSFYVLLNDSLRNDSMIGVVKNKLEWQILGSSYLKKCHCSFTAPPVWFQPGFGDRIAVACKKTGFEINRDAVIEPLSPVGYPPEMPKKIELRQIPGLETALEHIMLQLNFNEQSSYHLTIRRNDKPEIEIKPGDECSEYGAGSETANLNTVIRQLEQHPFPILKIHHRITPYWYYHELLSDDRDASRIMQEMDAGQKNSVQLFPEQDNIWAFHDTLGGYTLLYFKNIRPIKYERTPNPVNWEKAVRKDIDNDGTPDIVLEEAAVSDYDSIIIYIPNYIRQEDYENSYNYNFQLTKMILFNRRPGNNYYYAVGTGRQTETSLFFMKDGQQINILSYQTYPRVQRHTGWNYGGRKGRSTLYTAYVLRHPGWSVKTNSPRTAIRYKRRIIQLLTWYLAHPEKLPVDFNLSKDTK